MLFEEIASLFGKRLDDEEVVAFLARYPQHRVAKPSDGQQFVIAHPLGFDLLFQPPGGMRGGRSKHLRILTHVFLFREKQERHRQFTGVPFGAAFEDDSAALNAKLGPSYESSLTRGMSALYGETWHIDGFSFLADYDRDTGTVRNFIVNPLVAAAPAEES